MSHTEPPGRSCQDASNEPPAPPHAEGECPTVVHIDRWKRGDEAAFSTLHARFSPLLRARVRRSRVWPLLDGHQQVDDVVQEIWARALPALRERFVDQGRGSFGGYLGKLADRTMIDLARIHRAAKRGNGEVARTLQTDPGRSAAPCPGRAVLETPTSHARASELMQLAREELNDREYEAWDLVELQEFKADEAGLAMRCSGSAVRGLVMRSCAKLAARLDRQRSR